MLTFRNRDHQATDEPCKPPGTGVRHNIDGLLSYAAGHGGAVLQYKAATAPLERTGHRLHRHVAGGTQHTAAERKHFTLAGRHEVAVKCLVEGHASKTCSASKIAKGFGG